MSKKTDLHLYRLAVDELDAGHEVVEDHSTLGAGVEDDAVDLAAHRQRRVATTEHVHNIVHVCVLDNQVGVAFLVFLCKEMGIFIYGYIYLSKFGHYRDTKTVLMPQVLTTSQSKDAVETEYVLWNKKNVQM